MSVNNLISYIKDKSVLIAGFGREGKSTYSLIRKYLPYKNLTVSDKENINLDDENVKIITGESYLDNLRDYDLVFKSPGISFAKISVPETTEITCETDMFLRFWDGFTVGVTGTKGKTTTATLVYNILKESGIDAFIMGNMGVPVFDYIEKDKNSKAIIEMSSHQLEFTKSSPNIAVLTNIYEEHLDHYKDGFKGYVNAKLNIVKYQNENDFFIFNGEQGVSEFIDLNSLKSKPAPVYCDSYDFLEDALKENKSLRGKHNLLDASEALAAAFLLGAEKDAAVRALKNFKGVPHRMEYIGTFNGVEYYDDSIATIPKAVLCALDSLKNAGTLIIGGLDRGIDYGPFEKELLKSNLDNIICLPETGHKTADNLIGKTAKNVIKAESMKEAAELSAKLTKKGKACLLSPAAASYNAYRNFEEKGEHFKRLVKEYAAKENG